MKKVLGRSLLIILVLVVVLAIAAEFFLRVSISRQLSQQYGEDAEISFSAQPLVVGLIGGTINEVTVTTPSTLQVSSNDEITGLPATAVRLDDLELRPELLAGQLTTTTDLPENYLLAVTREQLRSQVGGNELATTLVDQFGITDMNANVEQQTLDVELAQGLAVLGMALTDVNGTVALEARDASLFGVGLPQEASQMITNALQEGVTSGHDQALEHLTLTDFEVVEGAVRLTLSGTNVPLESIE